MDKLDKSAGWRRRGLSQATSWLALWRWPPDPTGEGLHVLSRQQMRETMQAAYLAGFEAGRQDLGAGEVPE